MLNDVKLIGNLTRDPEELRYTPTGSAVCSFSIACNRKFGDKETTTFVDVTAWGKTAEFISKFLSKGRQVLVQGRLDNDSWDDKETGKKRSKTYVTAASVNFVGPKPDGATDGGSDPVDTGVGVGDDAPF